MTQKASAGDTVRIHYIGTLDNGEQFDSSVGSEPLEFILGSGHVIAGFDAAVDGMAVGEIKDVRIPAEEAYGPHREEMVLTIPREQLPPTDGLSVGQQVQMSQGEQAFTATVSAMDDDSITFDANHPLAGEALNFNLQLMEIR